MPTELRQCFRCDASQEMGFVMGDSRTVIAVQAVWVPGKPQPSFWTGIKKQIGLQRPLTAYRCERCGAVEFFAR